MKKTKYLKFDITDELAWYLAMAAGVSWGLLFGLWAHLGHAARVIAPHPMLACYINVCFS